jgi:hypothetical protein
MNKDFDCVDMKRQGAAAILEQTKGMTREQLIAFWAERSRLYHDTIAAAKSAAPTHPSLTPQRKSA